MARGRGGEGAGGAGRGCRVKAYCLGYTHAKCDTCQHEENWQTLNRLPDKLRIAMQKGMTRINSDKCRLTGMGEHSQSTQQDSAQAAGKEGAE